MNTDRNELFRIRRSPSVASEIIRELAPKKHLISVLKAVAHSVKVAHQASPSKWGLRLNRNSVMLKVGFVEVLLYIGAALKEKNIALLKEIIQAFKSDLRLFLKYMFCWNIVPSLGAQRRRHCIRECRPGIFK
jgi:hypothetical protein